MIYRVEFTYAPDITRRFLDTCVSIYHTKERERYITKKATISTSLKDVIIGYPDNNACVGFVFEVVTSPKFFIEIELES